MELPVIPFGFLIFLFALFSLGAQSIRILAEYQRGVVFRLGRVIKAKGPGLIFLIPIVDRMVRVDLRTVTMMCPHKTLSQKITSQ